MGYSFNPVSFWYLYSADKRLAALILEVNNTFDERHIYFLKLKEEEKTSKSSKETPMFSQPPNGSPRYTSTWFKEFHVSPFNIVDGSYSVVVYDPLYPSLTGSGPVNVTITLQSSKGKPKFVARIFSERSPINPATMTMWQKYDFLKTWWWIGLATFPRILIQAFDLYHHHQLPIFKRPEPLNRSMGRRATKTERILATTFRSYLKYLVRSSSSNLMVKYTPSGIPDAEEETFVSVPAKFSSEQAESLDFKVLTPVFYSRFIGYAHDSEAVFSELENKTIWISRPDILPKVILKKPLPEQTISDLLNYICFHAIRKLRRPPPPISAPTQSAQLQEYDIRYSMTDIRNFRLSAMDGYVLAECSASEQRTYRSQILKLFISERIAFGSVVVLEAQILLIRLLAALCIVQILQYTMKFF